MSNRGDRYVLENPAAEYFEEAVDAFLCASSSETASIVGSRTLTPLEQLHRQLRLSTLFCAFAAEAYVNGFLAPAFTWLSCRSLDRHWSGRRLVRIEPRSAPQVAGEARTSSQRGSVLTCAFSALATRIRGPSAVASESDSPVAAMRMQSASDTGARVRW